MKAFASTWLAGWAVADFIGALIHLAAADFARAGFMLALCSLTLIWRQHVRGYWL